jgi:hypothetical protein
VNLCLILAKVHLRLSVPFNQHWQCTSGEKVDYSLNKNQKGLWANQFGCHVSDFHLRAGNKINDPFFSCKTIDDALKIFGRIWKFAPAGLIVYVGTK